VDELTKEFLAESLEGLDRMDRCLTELEQRPGDKELLSEIFRSVHTIKGTTGFLGFRRLEKLAHAGETLLGSLRDGRLTATTGLVGGLLALIDGLRAILALIDKTGTEGVRAGDDDTALIALMEELNRTAEDENEPTGEATPLHELEAEAAPRPIVAPVAPSADKTLRIDVEVLNRMMNLVGELVLTRNQILQGNGESATFPELARRLDSVTADLRETVMQARMQPVGHVFGKFPRMVRDLALNCGKSVRLEFTGQDTGLDKSLLEAIKDPLTHAVRNAIDHGIEEPRARAMAGKPIEGVVSLRAYHHNGTVVIEVEDDGGGISTARVLAKAIERGLVTEAAAGMTEREALQLVFLPGFSTAAKVTTVSGRGVGMDVVLANVEKVGGTVEIESHEGQGTRLRLRVPLTLAIVRALVVRSGGQSFCLPQSSLAELVYVPWREAEAAIEFIGDAELYRLRENLLPMVRLDRMLGLDGVAANRQAHGFYMIVLESEGCQYGLVVDDLMAPEEIVVKPLSPVLREIGLFSGATVLGNGALAMILDVAATGVRGGIKANDAAVASAIPVTATAAASSSFLIFEDHRAGQRPRLTALPLHVVVRIESVAMKDVEYAGERPLLQYRGELLPLDDRGDVLTELAIAANPDASATVLICQKAVHPGDRRAPRRIGMVVRRVIEVASGDLLDDRADVCAEHLAMVNDRLTVLHDGFHRSAAGAVAGFGVAA
jgi:two-component system chemotaxis sensor kinase CheA